MLAASSLIRICSFLVVAAAAVRVTPAMDQVPGLPDTVMGERVREFLEVFNRGDAEEYRAFAQSNRTKDALQAHPMDARIRQFGEFKQMWDTLSLDRVVEVRPSSIKILVKDSNHGRYRTLDFHFEPQPPHKIELYYVEPVDDPALLDLHWDEWEACLRR